jgi:hypothetical protein
VGFGLLRLREPHRQNHKRRNDIAKFAYDALSRRIKRFTNNDSQTTHYYYNVNWQVLCEYDGSDNFKAWYVYGNYIDEVLMTKVHVIDTYYTRYYVHDHLYSPAALTDTSGDVVERYGYDAYGQSTILDPQYAIRDTSLYDNPYYFQGKRLDLLHDGNLQLMSWPYRDYSPYLGRWLQAEKRNGKQAKVNWRFTTEDARIKLKKLYPSIE